MAKAKSNVLPVLFGFFIMGFCDVVGIATSYVKTDFGLSETLAGTIPSMVFLWFLLISVPAAIGMNRIGRKNTVQISNAITFIGMLLPFINYSFFTCLLAFALLGIGNTVLQVSLNPLLTNVVQGKSLTSSLTAGQVIKAVSSLCGPLVAAFAAGTLGKWQYIFPIFAILTLASGLWLMASNIQENRTENTSASAEATFNLLKDRKILALFLGIFFIVGVDVGVNTVSPKLLMERCGHSVEIAGLASSIYFICRTAGALLGTFFLTKFNEVYYFRANIIAATAVLALLFLAQKAIILLILIGAIGFLCSSIFPIIYSEALKARQDKANEISGLMITGVSGGAVIPPAMGIMTDILGNQAGSLAVIGVCMIYLVACSLWLSPIKSK